MGITLPVRMGENNSEIVDANGALVAYTHGTALVSMEQTTRQIIASLNEREELREALTKACIERGEFRYDGDSPIVRDVD
jgi:hypothetical protein